MWYAHLMFNVFSKLKTIKQIPGGINDTLCYSHVIISSVGAIYSLTPFRSFSTRSRFEFNSFFIDFSILFFTWKCNWSLSRLVLLLQSPCITNKAIFCNMAKGVIATPTTLPFSMSVVTKKMLTLFYSKF